ncbi:hypothetical protein QG37_00389 [Candidozyma auris]|uniref:Uncharacterized protein n=1 Tax=Candidozyma auris TaxID=498019 RepID=A0A0L0P9A9_CANAR|nr:hypothetical protein QG37_00389 [[Candida] auris]
MTSYLYAYRSRRLLITFLFEGQQIVEICKHEIKAMPVKFKSVDLSPAIAQRTPLAYFQPFISSDTFRSQKASEPPAVRAKRLFRELTCHRTMGAGSLSMTHRVKS